MSETSSSSGHPALKHVRKGTKSCVECRYRKIRCVFRPNNASTCISCFSHGIRCASQAESEPIAPTHAKMNLSERVAQLEKELAALRTENDKTSFLANGNARLPPSIPPSNALRTSPETPRPPSALSRTAADHVPILSLFDNTLLTSNEASIDISNPISREFGAGSLRAANEQSTAHFRKSRMKRAGVSDALTDLFPAQSTMHEILEVGGFWWDFLRILHPYMCCEDDKMSIQSYVLLALNQDHPCIIGTALSWLAVSMQCLPLSYDTGHLSLPMPLNDLMQHYVSTIDRLIVCDDEISVCLEGIECILLQSQFYGNVGRPRKSWTILRKALSHALLLGLHKTPTPTPATPSPHQQRKENVWWHLIQSDAYLSLMLGLQSFTKPPPSSDAQIELPALQQFVSCDVYRKKLFTILSKIGDRNQAMRNSPVSTLATTMKIDQDLAALSIHLQPITSQTCSVDDARRTYERMITHFWHHQAKAYLHLPFMLQKPSSSEFDFNKTACISASREVVRVYLGMREFAGGRINLCRVVDFQVFTAAVVVILGLLGYTTMSALRNYGQDGEDWNLVYQTMGVLKVVSAEPENLIADQCFRTLEALASIANGQFSSSGETIGRKIFIPYFGMINVAPASMIIDGTTQEATRHLQDVNPPLAISPQASNPIIDIDKFSAFTFGSSMQNSTSVLQSELPSDILLSDTLTMDIDQDWAWMLNTDY